MASVLLFSSNTIAPVCARPQGLRTGEENLSEKDDFMFDSIGELAVVSVLLGATVFAFVYLALRGARAKRTSEDRLETGKGGAQHNPPKRA